MHLTEYEQWRAELSAPKRPLPVLKWAGWFFTLTILAAALTTLYILKGA